MSKEEKIKEKNAKILYVVKIFLENEEASIQDVSLITGISKSSVQRYLTSESVKDLTTLAVYDYIKERLIVQKKKAAVIGGVNSKKNNVFVKDFSGKFMGSVKK